MSRIIVITVPHGNAVESDEADYGSGISVGGDFSPEELAQILRAAADWAESEVTGAGEQGE